jgi:hypothetical protein
MPRGAVAWTIHRYQHFDVRCDGSPVAAKGVLSHAGFEDCHPFSPRRCALLCLLPVEFS